MSRRAWPERVAAIVLAAAVVAFVWALVDAVQLAPRSEPSAMGAANSSRANGAAAASDSLPVPDIGVAVARNVFSPTRRAPVVPYRLSRGTPTPEIATDGELPEQFEPVVLGTAVSANGESFAMCAYDDAPAVVVRVGDTLGPYTVVAIARGRVTFRDVDGTRLEVESPTSPDGDLP